MNQGKYQQFIFKDYRFDESAKELTFTYGFDDDLELCEVYHFDFDFVAYDTKALHRAIQNLFFMAGISYFKLFVPPEIIIRKGVLDQPAAEFLGRTYRRGLGEFWYLNDLDPNTAVSFPVSATISQNAVTGGKGQLVGVGGGKDSLVSIELMRANGGDITTWSLGHKTQLSPLVERIGLPHLWVERTLDPQVRELNRQGALNGHIPISAIFATVGTLVAILAGKRDVVVSNEQSANEVTLSYRGVPINHQYSKSEEFEKDYQQILRRHFGNSLRYYSLLRPFSELRVAEIFAAAAFAKYKDVFSSCNRAYTLDSTRISWCGKCPKCAFTFLVLTPFVPRGELEKLWGGKNLLIDSELEPVYKQLLGIDADKPLDCVGEIQESRTAMSLAQQQYLELLKYHYDISSGYNFRAMRSSSMPAEIFRQLMSLA